MRRDMHSRVWLACLLVAMLFLVNSCVYVSGCGCCSWAKYERQVELSAPLAPGSKLTAQTGAGSIQLEGTTTGQCRLLATIRTHASSEERARELADQIQVRLEPAADGLKTVIDKPKVVGNEGFGFSVSFAGEVPTETSLTLLASDGSIKVTHIKGTIDAKTYDGSIQGERIDTESLDMHTSDGSIRLADIEAGSCYAKTSDGQIHVTGLRSDRLELRTSDGSIRGTAVMTGRLTCHTSDGSIDIECTPETPSALNASLTTSDGSITFVAPPNLSAVIDATTNDGSIHSSLPITVTGKIGKSLSGTIGSGQGRVVLKTHDGSITIK